ncbi:MAG TPA: hypothetical protein VEH58_06670, partial [Dehalococcoidales bacterium]|nr:hypothetical protein [Dehalococcoidales bacterium]
ITFPVYWLEESQFVTDNDVVILSVPKLLINKFNQSKNSDEVTINFPNTYFTGLPVPPLRPVSESRLSEPIEGNVTLSMDYQQRIEYLHTSGDNILGAAGQTNPTYRYNPDSESFLAYHEIENYGSNGNDCIEVVTQYSNNTTSAKVFYCIYNNGVISVANPMFVSIDSTIDYTWYLEGTTYTVLLWDHVSDWIWGSAQDTTPPSDFYHFDGSSEFDTVGGLNGHICNVATYPVTITSLLTSSWQPASYVNTRLVYNLTTSPAQYVDIWSYKDSYGLQFYEYGGSSY